MAHPGGGTSIGGGSIPIGNRVAQLSSSLAVADQSYILSWLRGNLATRLINGSDWDSTYAWLDQEVIPYQAFSEGQLAFIYTQLAGDSKDAYESELAALPNTVSANVSPDSLLYLVIEKLIKKEVADIVSNIETYVDRDSIINNSNGMSAIAGLAMLRFALRVVSIVVKDSLVQQMVDGVVDGPSYLSFALDMGLAAMDDEIAEYGWTVSPDYARPGATQINPPVYTGGL